MARSLPVENLLPQNVGSIINYLQSFPEVAQWELLVAVNHNQLWTIASETVDPIDWSHPHPTHCSTPWAPRIAHCNAGWAANHKTCCTESTANVRPSKYQTNPVRPLRVLLPSGNNTHSGSWWFNTFHHLSWWFITFYHLPWWFMTCREFHLDHHKIILLWLQNKTQNFSDTVI